MIKKIILLILLVGEWLKRRWARQDEIKEHNEKVVDDAKDKIDNKAPGADVHTAIDRMRQR
jgi:hypothetical protein